jgi:rare lipoprotein A
VKRFAVYYIFVFVSSSLWGCALFNHHEQPSSHAEIIPPEPPKTEQKLPIHGEKSKRGELYRSNGRIYYPVLSKRGYEEKGIASWYGPSFHGRKTSSGETFDMHKFSAAHKLLPMHAKVTVTNLENGRSVLLTVNDRGPFIAGRVLDLSYGAAKSLGMVDRGLARVLIRASEPVPGQKDDDIVGDFFVHIGSFEDKEAASSLVEDMKCLNYKHSIIKVIRADRDGDIHWRVELGPYGSVSDANRAHSIAVKDYPSAFVVASQ